MVQSVLFLSALLCAGESAGEASVAALLARGDRASLLRRLRDRPGEGKSLFSRLFRAFLKARRSGSEQAAELRHRAELLSEALSEACGERHLLSVLKEALTWGPEEIGKKEQVDRRFLQADHLWRGGKPQEALDLLRGAPELCAALPYTKGKAAVLILRGKILYSAGRAEDAEKAFRRGLEAADSLRYRRYQCAALSALGSLYLRQSRYEEARRCFKRYRSLCEGAGDTAGVSRALGNEAQVALEAGRCAEAEKLYRLALSLLEGDQPHQSMLYLGLGRVASERRDWRAAFTAYFRARETARTDLQRARVAVNLGALWAQQGDRKRANEAYREALRLLGSRSGDPLRAAVLNNLGCLKQEEGASGEARRYFSEALGIFRRLGDHRMAGRTLANLCVLAWEEGKHSEAEKLYRDAQEALRKAGDRAASAGLLCERGMRQLAAGELSDARASFRAASELFAQVRDYHGLALSSLGLGKTALAEGEKDQARQSFQKAITYLSHQRRCVSSERYEALFFSRTELSGVFPLLAGVLLEQGDTHAAWVVSEKAKAQGLLSAFLRSAAGKEAVPAALREAEEKLQAQQASLRARFARARGEEFASLQAAFDRNEKEYRLLQEKIFSYLISGSFRPEGVLERARQRLSPGVVLLEFLLGQEKSYLFFVTAAGLEVFPLPGEKEISQCVEQLLGALRNPLSEVRGKAEKAGELLLADAVERIAEGTTLLVVPDGVLYRLPFGALRLKGRYLIEGYPIAYLPSLSFTALSPAGLPEGKGACVFGDPAYRAEEVLDPRLGWGKVRLERLRASRREAEKVAEILGGQVFLGAEATEAALRRVLPGCRCVHVAAHAFVHPEDPDLSCIILAGGEGEDGVFELRELERTPAELVVLSACESGHGELARGEGLLGFGRAFFIAGAKQLVVSLWPVNDVCAAEIMPSFYRAYGGGRSAASSLREAKLRFLREARAGKITPVSLVSRGRFQRVRVKIDPRHPFFWAGFVLQTREVPQ